MKISVLIVALLISFGTACAQLLLPDATLKKQWETGPGLKVPESVLFDSVSGIIYVSNVAGKPAEKDSTGFISTLSADGTILKTEWVKGIDAPKGMGIFNNHLFVSNIDEVVEIDISTATIVNRMAVEGSKFLNDIAVDPKTGLIFITDSGNGQVYILLNGAASVWLEGPLFKGANGLFLKNDILYIGTSNNILQADVKSGEVMVCLPNSGEVDGLYFTSENKFIFSDWKGSVFIAGKRQKPQLLLNTSQQKINAADFGVILSKNMILIPTFGNNKVMSYTSTVIK